MTAQDNLSPHQFYHGSNADFQPGDKVTTGHPMASIRSPQLSTTVSFSADPDWAATYGSRVYQVQPTGDYHPDQIDQEAENYYSQQPLRVMHEVVPDSSAHAYPQPWIPVQK